jgi:putative intracellular protease/amidase
MIDKERSALKGRLIKIGFWGASDPGDPTREVRAARLLVDRIEERLDAVLLIGGRKGAASDPLTPHSVRVLCGREALRLAEGDTYCEAVCAAAVALAAFLKRHPECARRRGVRP